VWEINLNPTIGSGAGRSKPDAMPPDLRMLRESGRGAFHSRLMAAFVSDHSRAAVSAFRPPLQRFAGDTAVLGKGEILVQ
jgi:hypothetical protein